MTSFQHTDNTAIPPFQMSCLPRSMYVSAHIFIEMCMHKLVVGASKIFTTE